MDDARTMTEPKKPRAKKAKPKARVWLGEQEKNYSCGPASLKYALCVLGYSPREEHIRKLAQTTWQGTETTKLMAAARRFGLKAKLNVFFGDDGKDALAWLHRELQEGRPVILDVEGLAHYVVAVQSIGGRVLVIDPEGATMNGTDTATLVLASDKRLRRWWLSGDEEGEPNAFRGISLEKPATVVDPQEKESRKPAANRPRPTRPRLFFSEPAVRRYVEGRTWILDEYLIDVVDIARGVESEEGPREALGEVVRTLGEKLVATRAAFWHEAKPAEIQMAKAHVEDLAVAAEAMDLTVPTGPTALMHIAVDVASLLVLMLRAGD